MVDEASNGRATLLSRGLSSLPPFPGRWRVTNALGKIASLRGDGHSVCSPWPGTRLEVDLHDRIQRLMWGGCYEGYVHRCLAGLLNPGDTFIDVGAHIGFHTVVGARLVGEAGKVYAFEADPDVYLHLERNARQFPWVSTIHRAVWREDGLMTFRRSPLMSESGWGTLTSPTVAESNPTVEVQTVALDEWARSQPTGDLTAMKIDAEGSELEILKGAERLLNEHRPTIIIEINDTGLKQAGTSSAEVVRLLEERDYRIYALSRAGLILQAKGHAPPTLEALVVAAERADQAIVSLRKAGIPARIQ